jgi:hypothetical protein
MENWTLDDWLNDLDNCVKRGLYFEISGHSAGLLRDQIKKAADEIERLRKDYALAWENHLLHEQIFVLTEAKIERLQEALRLAAPYVKDDPRVEDDFEYFPQPMRWEQYVSGGGTITAVSAIIKAALKEGE